MKSSRSRTLLAAALLALCAPVLAAPRGPRAIVNDIYKHQISFLAVDKHEYFSKAVVALWEKADAGVPEGELGAIDFDLASNSNGLQVDSIKVKTLHADATHATLEVTLISHGGDSPRGAPSDYLLRYKFIREGGRWLIDDMSSTVDGSPWTLRGLLGDATQSK